MKNEGTSQENWNSGIKVVLDCDIPEDKVHEAELKLVESFFPDLLEAVVLKGGERSTRK